MIRVFIGYDKVEAAAYHTLCHSIWRHASVPVSITPIVLKQLPELGRPRDPMQSNEFAFSRWLVPYLCEFKGKAIFMDCDMLFTQDIKELWDSADDKYSVQVVKHVHVPKEKVKFLGAKQTVYEKKNWSSVMLFNNSKCRNLTLQYVNEANGLDLHQFKWLVDEGLIGDLNPKWNHLVDYQENKPISEIANLHYTTGGPYFKSYYNCSYGREWWDEFTLMNHVQEGTVVAKSSLNK